MCVCPDETGAVELGTAPEAAGTRLRRLMTVFFKEFGR